MNILPSKTQVGQNIPTLEFRDSMPLKQMDSPADVKVFSAHGSAIQPIRRLIVLVPNADVDEAQIAREVWEMATAAKLAVLLLSMCNDDSEELRLQRRLITLMALIRDPRIAVEMHIEYGRDWLRGVKSVLADGDVILCQAEQVVGLRHQPLANVLSTLPVPVWTLSGLYTSDLAPRPRWLSTIIFWSGAIAIMAGFFYFQVQVNNLPGDLLKNVFLSMSVLVEIGSLYAWNSLFS